MEKCLVDLYSAVTQIDSRYFRSVGTRENGEQYVQDIETSFSTELYHRFKNIMELQINATYYRDLILHYDITKLAINGRPDIVLHRGQDDREDQRMFVEVKTNPNANLDVDFRKLKQATDDYFQFKTVVLVVANRTLQNLSNQIIQNFQDFDQNRKRKIFLITAVLVDNQRVEYNIYKFTSIRNLQ